MNRAESKYEHYASPKDEELFMPKDLTVPIPLFKNAKCRDIGKDKHTIVYLMEEDIFFCYNCQHPIACPSKIKELRKKMTITEGKRKFVYDRSSNFWLSQADAVWMDKQQTYVAKSAAKLWV